MLPSSLQCASRIAITFALAGAALPCAGQELLVNGDFDSDLAGWSGGDPPAPLWTAIDYAGNELSGSALLDNAATAANVRLYPLRQCMAAASGPYRIEASGFLAGGHPAGRLVVSYFVHLSANDCSGGSNVGGGFFVESNGIWVQASAQVVVLNAAASSIEVWLGIEKDAAGGTLQGNFDAVHVLGDVIFTDGVDGV